MMLFFIGMLEMIVGTIWTKTVTKTQVFASGTVTFINVLIWYYVLQRMIDDINNWQLAVLYAFGCALGTVVCMYYFRLEDIRKAKKRALKKQLAKSESAPLMLE